ncbi:hypothetical protein AUP68_14101 [Ilyonectria robusta]
MRTGKIALRDFLFTRGATDAPPPICSCGKAREDLFHVVAQCQRFHNERQSRHITTRRDLSRALSQGPASAELAQWFLSAVRPHQFQPTTLMGGVAGRRHWSRNEQWRGRRPSAGDAHTQTHPNSPRSNSHRHHHPQLRPHHSPRHTHHPPHWKQPHPSRYRRRWSRRCAEEAKATGGWTPHLTPRSIDSQTLPPTEHGKPTVGEDRAHTTSDAAEETFGLGQILQARQGRRSSSGAGRTCSFAPVSRSARAGTEWQPHGSHRESG